MAKEIYTKEESILVNIAKALRPKSKQEKALLEMEELITDLEIQLDVSSGLIDDKGAN